MTQRRLKGVVTALLLLGASPDQAGAQAMRSQMSADARAAIAIRASVRPMFKLAEGSNGLHVSSNAGSGVRYTVLIQPTPEAAGYPESGPAASIGSGDRQLVLIIPD